MEDIYEFAKRQHKFLVQHHDVENDSKTKYTMLAKLMEEVGELSEAILTNDSLQRPDKLKDNTKDLEGELADVILTTLVLSQELKVDIKKSLNEKIKKIESRKY